ncbi:HAMP domain-containing histidine kinase [Deinococcus metallilatus]|uniref:histidine kinase n=1 Tax=Deinococcus metallilatus TaxID=1211322 RepID=A0AAJ5F3M2_9DEIO|nr:HAMP domain-containing sensor histidine kinase [Deinococcus metallilatus]MBB5296397.1 signal transduction histidine kinase [Deinococcus metallilatus]QBY09929.1 HAMP domain-containing histidine kinase [Deinococcus metallilatus]RXJ08653.1 HAMP domain-containing histidine kinase [Deinococcus metallilatus]TLK25127.1 HAMP domain-containing histidine kinase [Deinococcus metallilatus]GMA14690.1 two-component sensor histidine kinase [Deinococcus metallilatus]
MKLFPRLFLGHLLVILVALGALFLVVELIAPSFYRHHVEQMVALIGPEGRALRPDLERGMRRTLNSALLAAVPFAVAVAALTASLTSRRIVRAVRLLSDGSQALAAGQYARRLPETGRDELAGLAHNFNVMAGSLERVEQDRAALIGNVGHELRTPLAALRGYSEALTDGVMLPEQAAPAIRREVRAMERLASDLSLVSRIEAGRVDLHPTIFSARSLLTAALERFGDAYAERGVTLMAQNPPDDLQVRADFERALQVLSNLLSNALRHTPPGGRVTLAVQEVGGQVGFSVEDTGSGIPADHLERIFERFYRVDPARTRGEGSGVGLTIARGLVEQMGGTVRVTSGEGGSTFTFTLPLA